MSDHISLMGSMGLKLHKRKGFQTEKKLNIFFSAFILQTSKLVKSLKQG